MASASSLCRVCLAGNIRMLHIYNEHLQIFEKITNLKLDSEADAGMPTKVCYVCHRLLQRCLLFSDMACRSDRAMRDMLRNGIEITCSTIAMLSIETTPILSVAPTQHISVIDYSNTAHTAATVNEEQFDVKMELQAEEDTDVIDRHEFEEYVNGKEMENLPTSIPLCLDCDVCNKKMSSMEHLIKHMITHTEKKTYSCKQCDRTFSYKRALTKHLTLHNGEKTSCRKCKKEFTPKQYLAAHMRRHTGKKPYSCSKRGKAFGEKSNSKQHTQVRTHMPQGLERNSSGVLKRRKCSRCWNVNKKRKDSGIFCPDCNVGLCIGCFEPYHTEKRLLESHYCGNL